MQGGDGWMDRMKENRIIYVKMTLLFVCNVVDAEEDGAGEEEG